MKYTSASADNYLWLKSVSEFCCVEELMRRSHEGSFSGKNGFTIMEFVVSMAVATVVATLTVNTIRSTIDSQKKSQDIIDKKTFLNLLSQPLNLSSVGMTLDSFDLARTLAGSYPKNDKTDLNKAWSFMPGTAQSPNFEIKHKGRMYTIARDSHSLDLAFADEKMNDSNRGAFLARCVDESLLKKRKKQPWSINEVLSLNQVPILHTSGNEPSLNCCRVVKTDVKTPYEVTKKVQVDVPYQESKQVAYQETSSKPYQVAVEKAYQVAKQVAYQVAKQVAYQVVTRVPYQVAVQIPYVQQILETYYETVQVAEQQQRSRQYWAVVSVPYQVSVPYWAVENYGYWQFQTYWVYVPYVSYTYACGFWWWGRCWFWGWTTVVNYRWEQRGSWVWVNQQRYVLRYRVETRYRQEWRLQTQYYWVTVYRNVQVPRTRWVNRTFYRTEYQTRYTEKTEIKYRTEYETKYRTEYETQYRTEYETRYRNVVETKYRTEYETKYRKKWKNQLVTEFKIENKTALDCQLVDTNSNLRSRVFRITEDTVSVWPSENAPSPVFSSGFFRHFNDPLKPSLMTIHTFVAGNPCIHDNDLDLSSKNSLAAKSNALCKKIKIELNSKDNKIDRNFYDSGVISISN